MNFFSSYLNTILISYWFWFFSLSPSNICVTYLCYIYSSVFFYYLQNCFKQNYNVHWIYFKKKPQKENQPTTVLYYMT